MPKELEKIRKDIMKGNPKMKESMAYALATNILKKRNGSKKSVASMVSKHEAKPHGKAHEKSESMFLRNAEKKMGKSS